MAKFKKSVAVAEKKSDKKSDKKKEYQSKKVNTGATNLAKIFGSKKK